MDIPGLLYVLVAHYLCGSGVMRLFRVDVRPVQHFFLSLMVGVPLVSFAPCVLELMHIPIETTSVYVAVALLTAIFSIPLLIRFKRPQWPKLTMPQLYEWPFILVCALFIFISVWRCFYYPPYARDMLSGPELLAEFAVREKTMVSSVYSVELSTTNNYFKSPFITSLQIIYKLLVCPFGQVWLSVLVVSFMAWMYSILRERIHPVLAGFLFLFFLVIPDMYAYTYIVLYDYSNMIFFFLGFYFLLQYSRSYRLHDLLFSAFLLGLATYIRTETLVFVIMLLPVPLYYAWKQRLPVKKYFEGQGMFLLSSVFFYVLCMNVFIPAFVPLPFDAADQVSFRNISFFFSRIHEINTQLIFSAIGTLIYGYFIFFFCTLLVADLLVFRGFQREALILLYGIAVVYVGIALLGYLIPLVDLLNTTKRGLFKALPLMLLYMANSPAVLEVSGLIMDWENGVKKEPVQESLPPSLSEGADEVE